MSARVLVGGNGKHSYADMIEGGTGSRQRPNGLAVYSNPYEVETYAQTYAVDTDGSPSMNIDGTAFPANTDNIHNGTDTAYWTASATVGTWTFNSAAQAFSGTLSIDGTATVNGDIAQFDRATSIDPADYIRLKGAAYISGSGTGGGTKALTIQFYNSSNVAVGSSVNLYNYINTATLNSWQEFVIPLSDFGNIGNDVDRLDLTVINTSGQPIDFYLDELYVEGSGGRTFKILPINNELTRIYELEMTVVDQHGGTAATAFDLTPTNFGWISALTEGLEFSRDASPFEPVSFTINNNIDFITLPGVHLIPEFADATNGVFKVKFSYSVPLELNPLTNDCIAFTVRDDLSGITSLTFGASATVIRKPDLTSF